MARKISGLYFLLILVILSQSDRLIAKEILKNDMRLPAARVEQVQQDKIDETSELKKKLFLNNYEAKKQIYQCYQQKEMQTNSLFLKHLEKQENLDFKKIFLKKKKVNLSLGKKIVLEGRLEDHIETIIATSFFILILMTGLLSGYIWNKRIAKENEL